MAPRESRPERDGAFLAGERVYLRPVERGDLPHIRRWVNDPEVRGLIGETKPMSEAEADAWFERATSEENRVWFVVVQRESGAIIGECGLLRMTHAWRTTDMSMIIGDRSAWGQGYGTEAGRLLLDYAFGSLNFHRVAVGVIGFNTSALRFWKKLGFRQEGIQRDGYYYNHQYHDFVMMSILEDEYRGTRD